MTAQLLRRLGTGATTLALAAGAAVGAAPAAGAAPAFTAGPTPAVVGDVTGDGRADRITLGHVGDASALACAAKVAAGLGHDRFAAPTVLRLPVHGVISGCPDLGVVLAGPTPARARLALAFSTATPADASDRVQLVGWTDGRFTPRGTLAATPAPMAQPSFLGTQDLDGDGWGDIWETTDQGDGFQAFVSDAGTAWHRLYATPFGTGATPQFFDLNHGGGIDVLVTWSDFGQGSGAAAVDGRTGAVQQLAAEPTGGPTTYQASVIDIDHDAYPDLLVSSFDQDGALTATSRFLNRSTGGRWWFAPVAS